MSASSSIVRTPSLRPNHIRFAKLSLVTSIAFFNAVILLGPATAYEISVYDSMGWWVWILGVSPIVFAAIALLFIPRDGSQGRILLLLALSLGLSLVTMVSMPLFRGYFASTRGDELTHIGIVGEILRNGRISAENFYPSVHILTSFLCESSNLDPALGRFSVVPYFAIAFLVGAFCMGRVLLSGRDHGLWYLLLASVPLLLLTPTGFTPTDASFAVIPLVVFVQVRLSTVRDSPLAWIIVFSMILIVIIFYHPQLCITLPIAMVLVPVSRRIAARTRGQSVTEEGEIRILNRVAFFGTVMLLVSFFAWFSAFSLFDRSFTSIAQILTGNIEPSGELRFYTYALERLSLQVSDLVILVLSAYGGYILLVCAAIVAVIIHRSEHPHFRFAWSRTFLSSSLLGFIALSSAAFLSSIVMPFGRVYAYVLLFSGVLVAHLLYSIAGIDSIRRTIPGGMGRIRRLVVLLFVVVFVILSVGSLYPSPRTGTYNPSVTTSLSDGHEWLIFHKDASVPVMEILGSYARYLDLYLGPVESHNRPDALFYSPESYPPDHFGYTNGTQLGVAIGEPRYLAFDQAALVYYSSIYPTQGSFNNGDFLMLEADHTVDRVFDNGEFLIFAVTG